MSLLRSFIGPRVPVSSDPATRATYRRPTWLLATAATLVLLSIFLPYWKMTLLAPQYPGGLDILVYVNRLTGDVREVDGLNHYIGMRPLEEAAQLERSVSIAAITIVALLIAGAVFIHTRWAALLTLPAVLLPFLFLADMYLWMRNFGLNLDPRAPLSSSIQPFIPPILGRGKVGQFETVASLQIGLYLALLAAVLIVMGLYYHRQAYKPLVDQAEAARRQE